MRSSSLPRLSCREERSHSPPAFSLYRIFQQKSDTRNRTKAASSAIKSLPDLSFLSHYSPLSPSNVTQQPRPAATDCSRTLKSIKQHRSNTRTVLPVEVHRRLTRSSTNLALIFHHEQLIWPCNPSLAVDDQPAAIFHEDREELCQQRHRTRRRCHTDIIAVDPILHLHAFTESPPNEFYLHDDDDDDRTLMNTSTIVPPLRPMNGSSHHLLDSLLERIHDTIKHLSEIKRMEKTFFLNNELNVQLDSLLKNDLCPAIQSILEHGLKPSGRDLSSTKRIILWKIIEISIDHGQVPRVYQEAKQTAQTVSSNWLYKFHAFIFALLNKSELVNWLYAFTRQKELLQQYYQAPDALVLVSIASTFNVFERMMTQLEKLTPLPFRLTYHPPMPSATTHNDQLHSSMISTQSTKSLARDWMMTMSRRASKTLAQPIVQPTFRTTLSRRFNALFTRNSSSEPQRKLPTLEPSEQDAPTAETGPTSVRYRVTTK